ncbi:phosphoenolpyruvate--protein phosphotransferase [Algicola sagamiensis]|uniref:phosphoenolpyruvate--protein phosphotransferase n=1 Tax=Algicola sagamiensis TaxID=163869 RepID=UPI0003740593|nr:phosphoenolpyruvate--protein phosphotransferase [Algicola sagamiensis]
MLTTFNRIVQDVSREPDLAEALSRLVKQVKTSLSTECCSIYLANEEEQHFILMATDGLSQDAVRKTCIPFSEGLVGLVGQREEPINIANSATHPRFKYMPQVREERFKAFLGVPILHERHVIGILTIRSTNDELFPENEEAFLVTLCAQLGAVLSRAKLASYLSSKSTRGFQSQRLKRLKGIPAAPGVAIGKGAYLGPVASFDKVFPKKTYQSEREITILQQALHSVEEDFRKTCEQMSSHLPKEALAIFDFYLQMLESPNLTEEMTSKIKKGWNAESALKLTIESYIAQFDAMEDDYIRERASDIRELGQRILQKLFFNDIQKPKLLNEATILIAQEVTPFMLTQVPKEHLKAIVSFNGSINSHTAIIARALGVPAIVALEKVSEEQLTQVNLIVDGYDGHLIISPQETVLADYKQLESEENELNQEAIKEVLQECRTKDGALYTIHLNAGLSIESELLDQNMVDGIGLYRTEIPFILSESFPSETKQVAIYEKVLSDFQNKPVIMRMLDVGGDKPLPYFKTEESNPFLGWRGIRMTLDHPEIFLLQVRAMIKASLGKSNLHILIPMVSDLKEVDESKRLMQQAYFEVCDELGNQNKPPRPKFGVMLEVPSMIWFIPELASRVDFISVGSNDLTQYILAVDRNNARVASLYNSLHPAVIRAFQQIIQLTQAHQIPIQVCGELAGEPSGTLLLAGMGYQHFSMNACHIARVKWALRRVNQSDLNTMAEDCLQQESTKQIRSLVNSFMYQQGLDALIRAGR